MNFSQDDLNRMLKKNDQLEIDGGRSQPNRLENPFIAKSLERLQSQAPSGGADEDPLEEDIQAAYFSLVRQMGEDDHRWNSICAIPNGGYRGKKAGAKMKREGQKAGVWDILIPWPTEIYPFGFIESKRPRFRKRKNGGLSEDQIKWAVQMDEAGAFLKVCYSTRELYEATVEYFGDIPDDLLIIF